MLKRAEAAVGLAAWLIVFLPLAGMAQEFGDFYGRENLRWVNLRYGPLLSGSGSGGELMFGFNTLSKRTGEGSPVKYFYGVSLGGGSLVMNSADLGKYGERDAVTGHFLFSFDFKLFTGSESDLRPYVGGWFGYGGGTIWAEDIKGEDSPTGSLSIYAAGAEAGIQIMLERGYALNLAAGVDARALQFSDELRMQYPAMVTVGVCRWLGPLNHR